ncbi:hypothetical protein K502DRAFT_364685 [Neoconidiobolus thromboides FSU 785]|nr:hypothetical protein K502DRAFT_364685 [Neoconidiobolus thromboides FSU 785]
MATSVKTNTTNSIQLRLNTILKNKLVPEDLLNLDSQLIDFGLDGSDMKAIVQDINNEFQIQVTNEEIYELNTLEDLVQRIVEKAH